MNLRLPFICAFMLILSFAAPNTAEIQPTYSDSWVSGVRNFSNGLAKTVFKTSEGNVVVAPISVLIPLYTLSYGADGETKKQIDQATSMPITDENSGSFGQFYNTLNSVASIKLHLANKLFVQRDFEVQQDFQNFTTNTLKAEAESIDFKNAHEAVGKINKWAEDHTDNNIHDLITAADLDKTVMVIVNAIYLKGSWVYSFPSELKQKNFYVSASESVSVPMMCNNAPYNYGFAFGGTAEYAEIPYSGNEFSAYLIVPQENIGVSALSAKLHEIDFSTMSSTTPKANITVCMPKPKIEKSIDLIPVLKEMGIHDMFTHNASFPNISPHHELEVNKFVQKAFFSANEEGSEAGAATAVGIGKRIIGPKQFIFDKPGMIAVVHKPTGIPIFWASFSNPSSQ